MSAGGIDKPLSCSVVICSHNRPSGLRLALTAVKTQSRPPDEILVIGSGSKTDEIEQVAAQGGARYIHEVRMGAARARNRGLSESISEVVAFTDDDAEPATDWLERLLLPFSDAQVSVVTGHVRPPAEIVEEDLELLERLQGPVQAGEEIRIRRENASWFEVAAFGGLGNGPNMAFRRPVAREWKCFDTRLGPGTPFGGGEELLAYTQIAQSGHTLVYTPRAVVIHPTSYDPGQLRERVNREPAKAVAYMLFLILETPFRWRALKYLLEAIAGKKRTWRMHRCGMTKHPRGSRLRQAVDGIALYLESRRGRKSAYS